MSIVPVESARFETMNEIAELDMHGWNPTEISKKLGIPRKEVKNLLDEWSDIIRADGEARDMARDYMHKMVKHYDGLIKKFYELLEEINTLKFGHLVAAQKNAALKAIADLERQRLDALQRAGLLDSAELGDELAEVEEKQAIIIGIIQNDICPACKQKVAYKITQLTGKVEPIVVESEVLYG